MKKHPILLSVIFLIIACKNTASNNSLEEKPDFKTSLENGKIVYNNYCITCHMANGEGVPKAFPPLAKSDYLMIDIPRAIKIVKYGQQGEITVNGKTYNGSMTPLGLSDKQIADVLNYITNSWGNTNDNLITVNEVSSMER
ncbi:c-type cytochrome [Mangrovimonas spongiae]|uniref:Cytochrome c n=1 Tax=Mangrovimonas spongiae TaxID=2494697 RepID=A0A3R9N575_9FLAO|nr:cytochrome c [Mangrovimonas spongiae]RSK39265.1 cytochrome c [Mangrovimonas spongiae]